MDAEEYSNEVLEQHVRQSTEDFDLIELQMLIQPAYDQMQKIIWDYTMMHSYPATED